MKGIRQKRIFSFFLIFVLAMSIIGCSKKEEGLVAKVDGVGITEDEFNTRFEIYKNITEQQLGEGSLKQVNEETGKTGEEELKEDILEMLIMEKIIANEASKANLEVTDDEVNAVLNQYVQLFGGEEQFNETLENSFITKEFLAESIKNDLLLNKHKEYFIENATVTEEEAQEYFEENKDDLVVIRARHILVKTEEEGKEVLERLKNGEDFAKVAEEVSVDKVSAMNGGDLGYFGKGSMIAEFEEAAFSLEPGETSDLVKTEVGYHIIRVEDKRDTFESLKDDIIEFLKEQKYYDNLQQLRENAKVKIYI
ncbi:MAG TPA: peptidylprolyl isomerase [Tissierellaceae bacterium]